jgi:hypothetical protein
MEKLKNGKMEKLKNGNIEKLKNGRMEFHFFHSQTIH